MSLSSPPSRCQQLLSALTPEPLQGKIPKHLTSSECIKRGRSAFRAELKGETSGREFNPGSVGYLQFPHFPLSFFGISCSKLSPQGQIPPRNFCASNSLDIGNVLVDLLAKFLRESKIFLYFPGIEGKLCLTASSCCCCSKKDPKISIQPPS